MTRRRKLQAIARMILGLCPIILALVDWTPNLTARVAAPFLVVLAVAAVDREWESTLYLGASVGMLLSLVVLPGRVSRPVQLGAHYVFCALLFGLALRSWRRRTHGR